MATNISHYSNNARASATACQLALADDGVWSVVCFWVPKVHRNTGVADAVLAGAVHRANAHHANVIEGYPIDTGDERRAAATIYQGTLEMFRRAGFVESYRRKPDRPVVTRVLNG